MGQIWLIQKCPGPVRLGRQQDYADREARIETDGPARSVDPNAKGAVPVSNVERGGGLGVKTVLGTIMGRRPDPPTLFG